MTRTLSDRDVQELETLAGIRRMGANAGQAAVRLDDLNGLLRLPDTLQSVKATGGQAPTEAEFNALVEDVHLLHTRLLAVIAALRVRRGR